MLRPVHCAFTRPTSERMYPNASPLSPEITPSNLLQTRKTSKRTMPEQELLPHSEVLDDVRYLLETTFKHFSLSWDKRENDFDDLLRRHKGTEKHSVRSIHTDFSASLKTLLRQFVSRHMWEKIRPRSDYDRFILLTIQGFSYLRKTKDWFRDTFSDFDTVEWPLDNSCSYTEACQRVLHKELYRCLRKDIGESYVKLCRILRSKYSYENLAVFDSFHEKRIVPLFESLKDSPARDDVSFWWESICKYLHVDATYIGSEPCEESFIILSRNCRHIELLLVDHFPDDEQKGNYKKFKRRLEKTVCTAYYEGSNGFSFLGLMKQGTFDGFLFKELLSLQMCSWEQHDLFLMYLRSHIRLLLEQKVLNIADVPRGSGFSLEQLKTLLTDLDDSKTLIMERLKPFLREYPTLLSITDELSKSLRDSIQIYHIGKMITRTQAIILNGLKHPRRLDSAFFAEAKYIALFIKHLTFREEVMKRLDTFAEIALDENRRDDVKTLAAFVSRHRSVCSTALYNRLHEAGLIET